MCGSTVRVPRSQPPAYGSSKVSLAVQQRAEEHDAPSGYAGRRPRRSRLRSSSRGRDDLEVVVVVEPAGLHADAVEHLEQPVDLLDPGDLAQRGAAAVEQRGAQQRDAGVLRRSSRRCEPDSVVGPVTRRCVGPAPSETISESRASPIRASISRERFWWPFSIRLTALWLVPSTSASCVLGQAAVLAGVADEVADAAQVVVGHARHRISYMR